MANMSSEQYTKTYSTFGGSDIVATFNGHPIAEIQAITYSITREKTPVYTLGSPEPRSFSRGKRGIAGNLVFISFNRDALIEELGTEKKISKYKANDREWLAEKNAPQFVSVEEWDKYMAELANPNGQTGAGTTGATIKDLVKDDATPVYADEILPFDITISFANEYGAKATTVLYGVELLNEGIGFSIDSTTTERAYTFVCRSVDTMKAVNDNHQGNISTTW